MFCKNCGNRLDDDDKVCTVCGSAVEPEVTSEESGENEAMPSGTEDIKTPLFDFKWNVQDFPKEGTEKTEEIDFEWETPKESPIVEKMRRAVDPEEIASTPTFSEEEEAEEPITDEWYEPFSVKKDSDDNTLLKFNKRNEEFQELLDKEFEKYSTTKRAVAPNEVTEVTKKYNVDDFKNEQDRFKEDEKEEVKLPESVVPKIHIPSEPEPVNVITPEDLGVEDSEVTATEEKTPAGIGIFDTTFASPLQVETETSKVEEPADDAVDIFDTEAASPAAESDASQAEIFPQKAEDVFEEKISESESSVNPAGLNIIDTSFSSPFAKVSDDNEESQEKASDDNEEPREKASDDNEESQEKASDDNEEPREEVSDDNEESQEKASDDNEEPREKASDENEEPREEASAKQTEQDSELHKVIGPEIVNEPVVFPFELGDEDEENKRPDSKSDKEEDSQTEPPKAEELSSEKKNDSFMPKGKVKVESYESSDLMVAKEDVHSIRSNKFIKFLIVMIVIISVLLAGIAVMKLMPNSAVGIMLNNLTETLLSGSDKEEAKASSIVPPNDDYEALINAMASESENIDKIIYNSDIKYDETASYSIMGANSSKPIEDNFWKVVGSEDLLFDEQAVKTIIGFNSAWVSFLNDGNKKVFDYVVPGSGADKALTKEKFPKGSKNVVYKKLVIGEIRQNGNKFYVWTQENITVKSKDGTEKKPKINQVYELETGPDSLLITTYVTL